MLVVHALWEDRGDGALLVWAEDGEAPASLPAPRGRPPARPRPRPHPFAAEADALRGVLEGTGDVAGPAALAAAEADAVVLWLPGTARGPLASPWVVRQGGEEPAVTGLGEAVGADIGLRPFLVEVLRLAPAGAADVLPALAAAARPGLQVGRSVAVLAALAELALEMVAGGRVLPDLVADGGTYRSAWRAVPTPNQADRRRALVDAFPPSCRSRREEGEDPGTVVDRALGAMLDAVARGAPGRVAGAAPGGSRTSGGAGVRRGGGRDAATAAWLRSLGGGSPVVEGDPGELAELASVVAGWRAGAAGDAGPWRLCFRLREPPDPAPDGPAPDDPTPAGEPGWSVEFLLQAVDDPSLMVEAAQVWRSGAALRRAARTLQSPQETLLAELGRAVKAFPELSGALDEPAPTAMATDLAGAHRFLAEVAPVLDAAGFGVLLPSWWRRPGSRLGIRLRARGASTAAPAAGGAGGGLLGGDGLVEFDWQAALGDHDLDVAELRRLARLKAPLVRVRGQWTELRPEELEALVAFLGSDRRREPVALTVPEAVRAAAGVDSPVPGLPVLGVEADGPLGALLRGELEDAVRVRGTPEGFAGSLRPYQERAVAWLELLERTGLGACLADDMGLGKTATVLALVQAAHRAPERPAGPAEPVGPAGPAGPTLVICPTSVVGNWQREALRFTPELSVHVHHGATRARAGALRAAVEGVDLVVTSYPLVARDRAALAGVPWARLVLDEAQNVKNPAAQQTRAVRSIAAPRRVALTGTPVENHLGELWSIMEILNPGLLGTATAFREEVAIPVERYRDPAALARLRQLTGPFVLRRLKTDPAVRGDLPDKLEMKVACSLTREQASLYQAVVDQMLERIDSSDGMERKGLVLSTMLRLKQVCNHPAQYLGDGSALTGRSGKLERTAEILGEVLECGERALVFTQFQEMGALLREELQRRLGCRVAYLHGAVPRHARDAMVEEFQDERSSVPVMVLSLKAGGTGLTLTAASHVVHFDRWWNPAVEDQATDRAYRIGQRRDVQVRKLVCAGTLEDRIDQMIESKKELAALAVGTGEAWLTELTTAELAQVLQLSADAVEVG